MALRDQPYLPLYVQDFLTDEKLSECSAESTGVYIRLMCLMHKSEDYGTISLKQKDKQTDKQIRNFAVKLARLMPFDTDTIERSLSELIEEQVLEIDGDTLFQKRMVKDGELSNKRALAGRKGGNKTEKSRKAAASLAVNFAAANSTANPVANTENEYEYENDIDNDLGEEVETTPRARGAERKAEIKNIWDSYVFSPNLSQKVKEWGQYKKERGDSYKPQGLKSLLTQVKNNAERYGDDAVISVIDQSMASGYEGITWNTLPRLPDADSTHGALRKKSFSEIIAERQGGGL